jgi:hypothetical protein
VTRAEFRQGQGSESGGPRPRWGKGSVLLSERIQPWIHVWTTAWAAYGLLSAH